MWEIINRKPPADILARIMEEAVIHKTEEDRRLEKIYVTSAEMMELHDKLHSLQRPDCVINYKPGKPLRAIKLGTNLGEVMVMVGP
jgi:hypothetical protein